MLNRSVCLKCCQENYSKWKLHCEKPRDYNWMFDMYWDNNIVNCYGRKCLPLFITEQPPDNCPYVLEHTVQC